MSASPPMDVLNDDAFAPLKRNHACLECKKRKIRCDATHPACGPCMRSHAHSARSAQKNRQTLPVLVCTWPEGDSPEPSMPEEPTAMPAAPKEGRKKNGEVKKARGSLAGKNLEREKEKRRDEDRDTLLARIADLESRLAGMSPSDSSPASHQGGSGSSARRTASTAFTSVDNSPVVQPAGPEQLGYKMGSIPENNPSMASGSRQAWVEDVSYATNGMDQSNSVPTANLGMDNMDFSRLFMVPANWPLNLPSPFLLEHLVETFFTHAPQMPRMIHRPSLMTRLKLPPTHPDFPHASLLHAMCASAASYTAWVNSLPPEALDESVERHKKLYGTIEGVEDFGLAQAEASQKSIRMSTQACIMGPGNMVVEITQANIILSDLYFTKGMPLQGWIVAGTAPRLLKSMEFMNRNKRIQHKEPLVPVPKDAIQREERLATVWMAYIMDAGYALNSYWGGSMELDEVLCNLPIAADQFNLPDVIAPGNSQSVHSPDALADHPVADSFVLVAKATTLISRVAKWIRLWNQREIVPGDEHEGLRQPSFTALVNDIFVFQASMPSAMRNIFRLLDASSSMPFDANIMLVHILPNIALCMIHEPFVDWQSTQYSHSLTQIQRAYEAILGALHLVPSNLDISLIMTSLMCFCLYTVGRLIAHFVQRSSVLQQYGLAVRHRADLQTVQNILARYGQKHRLGHMMNEFLGAYLDTIQGNKPKSHLVICSAMEEYQINAALRSKTLAEDPNPSVQDRAEEYLGRRSANAPNVSTGAHLGGMENWAQRFTSTSSSSTSGPSPPVILNVSPANAFGSSGSGTGTSSGAPTPLDVLDFSAHGSFDMGQGMNDPTAYGLPGFGDAGMMEIDAILNGGLLPHEMGGTGVEGQKLGQHQHGQQHQQYPHNNPTLPPMAEAFPQIDGRTLVWGGT